MKKLIFLHEYVVKNNKAENISEYNAPHKYRFYNSLGYGNCAKMALKKFLDNLGKLEQEIFDKLKNELDQDFFYAFPKTSYRNQIFNKEIKKNINKKFTKSVDISDCFIQNTKLNSTKYTQKLANGFLKSIYTIDEKKLKKIIGDQSIGTLLLIDDVYSNGNTFRSMELALDKIIPSSNIIGFVILKT